MIPRQLSYLFVLLTVSFAAIGIFLGLFDQPSLVGAATVAPPAIVKEKGSDYLLALPLPEPGSLLLPSNSRQPAEYLDLLAYQQAEPILQELQQLRSQGQVLSFQVRPDLYAVSVQVAAGKEGLLVNLPTAALFAFDEEKGARCAAAAGQVLAEQIRLLNQQEAISSLATRASNSDLVIDVYAPPGSSSTSISGRTFPSSSLELNVRRGQTLLATESTTSTESGYYYFYPDYQYCDSAVPGGSGYEWTLQPGDIVEVRVGALVESTTVVHLSSSADPTTNMVSGVTQAGRAVEVRLYQQTAGLCTSNLYSQSVTAQSNGGYDISFGGQIDFDRSASAFVYARDAQGHSTYNWFLAHHLTVNDSERVVYGYLKPEVAWSASVSRGGGVLATRSGTSSGVGYYSASFSDSFQAGDVVRVAGGGAEMSYTIAPLALTFDAAANQLMGTTTANRKIEANFYGRSSDYALRTSCSSSYGCSNTVSDGSGNFVLTSSTDLQRGDYGYIYLYDAEGNYQYSGQRSVPAVIADLSGTVAGYWGEPYRSLTIVLKDSGGTPKATLSNVWASYGGAFNGYVGDIIVPGDRLEVGNGIITETMTVQGLTARLTSETAHLTGAASNGALIASLYDFRPSSLAGYTSCHSTVASGGAYDLNLASAQLGPQDTAVIWSRGPDGHYTRRWAPTFTLNLQNGTPHGWGYSETPQTTVTINLERGGSTIATHSLTSSRSGFYNLNLPSSVMAGDVLRVQSADGNSGLIDVPQLSINIDKANNRLYGRAPANKSVQPSVRRHSSRGWSSASFTTSANASGDYNLPLSGSWSYDCSPIDVSHNCAQGEVTYYTPDGHRVWALGAEPSPLPSDSLEGDDSITTASPYEGPQPHTFHQISDADYVSFTVSAQDVELGAPYRIETTKLGWYMDTVLHLYAPDGTTLITSDDDGGYGTASLITWIPGAAGTYYVRVSPYNQYSTSSCDARYELTIQNEAMRAFALYLPITMRTGITPTPTRTPTPIITHTPTATRTPTPIITHTPTATQTPRTSVLSPFDATLSDLEGPSFWARNYGKAPEIIVSSNGVELDVLAQDYDAGTAWNAVLLHIEPSATGYRISQSLTDIPMLDQVMGLATDEAGNRYYATGVDESAVVDSAYPPLDTYRSNIVRVIKLNQAGAVQFNIDLDTARYAYDNNAEMMINPMTFGSSRLAVGGNEVALVHSINTDPDWNIGGARHQKALSTRLNATTGAISRTSSVWVSHSFDQRLLYDGAGIIEHHLGDAYPRYIVFARNHVSYPLFRIKGAVGDNNTHTKLGNVALIENDPTYGYLTLFVTENSTATGNRISGPRNLAIVRNNRTDNSIDPTLPDTLTVTSAGTQYTNRLRWLTTYSASSNLHAERPKLIGIGNDQYIVLWEEWLNDTFNGVYGMVIDAKGNILHSAKLLTNTHHLHSGDDAFFLDARAAWMTGSAAEKRLYIHFVDASLNYEMVPVD